MKKEQINQAAPLFLKVMLALMMISITLPIFSGYLSGLILLGWIVYEQVKGRLSVPGYLKGLLPHPPYLEDWSPKVVKPAVVGMYVLFLSVVLAAGIGMFSSPFSAPLGKTVHVMLHQMVKLVFLGSVSLIAVLECVKRGGGTRFLAKTFLIWLAVHFVYCLIQRYTGCDIAHGLSARLGEHRFAYGVYRVSGFMGHPLTLTYNLMLVFLGSIGLAMSKNHSRESRSEGRLWFGVSALALLTLLISGSRFVLIVLVMVPLFCEMRRIVKHWKLVLGGLLIAIVGLWIEGSIVNRFSELFAENQSLYERFPRLVFWKMHWKMFLDHPIAGVSMSGIDRAMEQYYLGAGFHDKMYTAHNVFLQFLADSGIIGFVGLIAFFAGYLKSVVNSVKLTKRSNGLAYLLIATFLVAVQQNNLRDSEFLLAFWFFTALLYSSLLRIGSTTERDKREST